MKVIGHQLDVTGGVSQVNCSYYNTTGKGAKRWCLKILHPLTMVRYDERTAFVLKDGEFRWESPDCNDPDVINYNVDHHKGPR